MTRETITIETPIAHLQVVLKTWITGREFESLNEPLLKNYKINTSKNSLDDTTELTGNVINEMTHQALKVWVVSINGDEANVVDRLLDTVQKEDYQFVIDKINELSKKK